MKDLVKNKLAILQGAPLRVIIDHMPKHKDFIENSLKKDFGD
jgi:hypothetical protein